MSVVATGRRTWRSIREHLYLFAVSTGVITTSLVLIGMFAIAARNLGQLVGTWEQDVHVSAYFLPTVAPEARPGIQTALAARPEVAAVRYVSEAEAIAWMTARTPDLGPVMAELGSDALPASLEITLRDGHTSAEAIRAFAASLEAAGTYEDVDFGQEWVTRFTGFLNLLTATGVALGGIILVATLFLVGNTIHLVVHARRDELEVMRLVGATDGFIVWPFVLEGAIQGLLGGLVAIGTLYGVYRMLVLQAGDILTAAVGQGGVLFLSTSWLVGLVMLGMCLGTTAAWGAVRRFLGTLE